MELCSGMKETKFKWLIISSLILFSPMELGASDTIVEQIDKKIQFFFEESYQKKSDKSVRNNNISKDVISSEDKVTDPVSYQNLSPEELIERRFEELNKISPIKLEYNSQVKRFIDIYTTRRKHEYEKILGLSELYFPIFEEAFDKYNLPLELKYLSVVESSLNPLAVSPSGAVGLWQFLYNTSIMFDLEITSYIDERRDPDKSTDAACRYFAYLYNIFQDWQLAIASFNGGPGEIRNAIERSGGKTNFWELQPYLAKQTRNYVPAFIASYYVLYYADELGLVARSSKYTYFNTDTVKIKNQITFDQISNGIDVPKEELRFLNPIYKADFVPAIKNYSTLILPANKIVRFLRMEKKIYASDNVNGDYFSQLKQTGDTIGKVKLVHKVTKGEFFHKIALNYRCTIEDIKKWNHLESDHLYPGQELIIWVPQDKAHLFIKSENTYQQDGFIIYTVQEGDTIWSIAEKFNVKSIQELKNINTDLDENNIKPGQKIKINW